MKADTLSGHSGRTVRGAAADTLSLYRECPPARVRPDLRRLPQQLRAKRDDLPADPGVYHLPPQIYSLRAREFSGPALGPPHRLDFVTCHGHRRVS
jgi:hypothetical protein